MWFLSTKVTFSLSSAPGPTKNYRFKLDNGKEFECDQVFGIGPRCYDAMSNFILATINNNLTITQVTDRVNFERPEEFQAILTKNLDLFMNPPQDLDTNSKTKAVHRKGAKM